MKKYFVSVSALTGLFLTGFLIDILFNIPWLSLVYHVFEDWQIGFIGFCFIVASATIEHSTDKPQEAAS